MMGKLALITGASSGIGAEYARQLAATDYDLILTARREERLQALAAELGKRFGVAVEVVVADLATDAGIQAIITTIKNNPQLDLLINNAGFGTEGHLVNSNLERELAMLTVHIDATMAACQTALPAMIERGSGQIINVSSIAAFMGGDGSANYYASKAYLNKFSEILQNQVASQGIHIQALCPGFTYTEFHDTSEYDHFERSDIPKFLWSSAEEVVAESLAALQKGPVVFVPGLKNRLVVRAQQNMLARIFLGLGRRILGV